MGRWDKLIVNQAFDVPTISFFIISYRLMPNPCQFYFDIKFGERLYSKEKMPGTPLLFIFIFAFKKKKKKKRIERVLAKERNTWNIRSLVDDSK